MSDYSFPGYSSLIGDMKQATADGSLKWRIEDDFRHTRRDVVVGHVYAGNYRGRLFALHEAKTKYYYDEEAWSWQHYVQLEMVDQAGRMLWEMPSDFNQREAGELIIAVREKTSGINELIESVIRGEDPKT